MGNLLKIAQKRRSIILATPFVWDTDFQNVMDYATTEGIALPSIAKLKKANNLLVAMKNAGIWSKLDAFVNFAYNDTGADEFSLIDWKRLSEMTIHGGMVYTVNGWEGNAIDGYMDTLFNPEADGVNYTLNDASRVFIKNKQYTTGNLLSSHSNNSTQFLYMISTAAQRINSNTINLSSPIDFSPLGFLALIRDDDNNVRGIVQNNEYNRTQASSLTNWETTGTLNVFGRAIGNYTNAGLSLIAFGASLTYTETQEFRTAYNTYLTSIGLSAIA